MKNRLAGISLIALLGWVLVMTGATFAVVPLPAPTPEEGVVYLPALKADPTRTRTPTPMRPTATPTPRPTETALPTAPPRPMPTALATPMPGRVCDSTSADWRGPVYPFCVMRDMGWTGQSASVQTRRAGSGEWMTVVWDFYGADLYDLRLEHNTGIGSCATRNIGTGKGGFRRQVGEGGSVSFNINDLGLGLYKAEMFVRKNGVWYGHNEVFVCVVS